MEQPLFEYYDIHLTGLVVSNREVPDQDDDDKPDDEPELVLN